MSTVRCAILAFLALPLIGCFPPFIVGDGILFVEGTVSDSMGRPVPDALVLFDTTGRSAGPYLPETHTGSDGRFQLSDVVAPGRYDVPLIVWASGYRNASLGMRTNTRNTVGVTLEREDSGSRSRIVLVRRE